MKLYALIALCMLACVACAAAPSAPVEPSPALAATAALAAPATPAAAPTTVASTTADARPATATAPAKAAPTAQPPRGPQGTRAPEPRGPAATPAGTPAPRGGNPGNPGSNGSDASQSLPLEVPVHPANIVLGRPTDRSITASVLPFIDGDGYIAYGVQRGNASARTAAVPFASGAPVEIVIDALQPDTAYTYRLFYRASGAGSYTALDERGFHTQRAPGSAFTFTIQADSHLDSNSSLAMYARTLGNMLAAGPDFLIDLGDTFMTDKYQPFAAARPQYLAQRYYLGTLAPSPLFLALGNHDGEAAPRGGANSGMPSWSAALRTQYFPNPLAGGFYSGNATPDKTVGNLQDYYAWTWGDALFVVLDPYWFTPAARGTTVDNWAATLGSAQYQWLKQTLEGSKARWKFIFIHQLVGGLDKDGRGGVEAAPLYEWGGKNPDGSSGFAAQRPGWPMPIHQLLVANKVNAVFHGHDHLFVKQDLDGIVYQELPQPSTARYDSTASARDYGYVSGDLLGGPGYLKVSVSAAQVTADYIRTYLPADENAQRQNGRSAYSYTLR